VKVKVKKASNALKNRKRMNKPVLDLICKKSAAFISSLPVKPIKKSYNFF
tara:strand:+ start:268 stop:417 length:150 start_codon:yes stop_codon:yes gene_type:complete